MKVHCTTCASMVPGDGVHSCFDAALLKTCIEVACRHREAERAVIEAAGVMADFIGQPPTTDSYHEWMVARNGLMAAVATLRELEGKV